MDAFVAGRAVLLAAAVVLSLAVSGSRAQETPSNAAVQPPADVSPPPPAVAEPPDNAANDVEVEAPRNRVAPPVATPPPPARAQAAVLRVLDKVTAETMAFEAPIGRRVRYKSLVFEVKTCVTRGTGDARPRPSAYLTITSDAGAATGAALGPRQVFKGWMFAEAPGINALTHPVYDAWLVSCDQNAPAL